MPNDEFQITFLLKLVSIYVFSLEMVKDDSQKGHLTLETQNLSNYQ